MQSTARFLWQRLEPYHGLIYFVPEADQHYVALGLDRGMMGYFGSRSAAMGAVPAEVVIATFFNFEPSRVHAVVPEVWQRTSPQALWTARLDAVDAALRRLFGDRLDRTDIADAAEMLRGIVPACRPEGRPLFAGHLAQALGVFVNDAEGLDPEVLDHPPGEGVAEPRDGRRDEVALDAGHRARVFDDHPLDLEAPAVAAVLGPPAGEAHRLADRHVADGPHRDLFALRVAQAGDREGAVGGLVEEAHQLAVEVRTARRARGLGQQAGLAIRGQAAGGRGREQAHGLLLSVVHSSVQGFSAPFLDKKCPSPQRL